MACSLLCIERGRFSAMSCKTSGIGYARERLGLYFLFDFDFFASCFCIFLEFFFASFCIYSSSFVNSSDIKLA